MYPNARMWFYILLICGLNLLLGPMLVIASAMEALSAHLQYCQATRRSKWALEMKQLKQKSLQRCKMGLLLSIPVVGPYFTLLA